MHVEVWVDCAGNGGGGPVTDDENLKTGGGYSWGAAWEVPANAIAGPIKATAKVTAGGIEASASADGVIRGVRITSLSVTPATVRPGKDSATVKAQVTAWGFEQASVPAHVELWADVSGRGDALVSPVDGTIDVGRSYDLTSSWPVPADARPGAMRVTAKAQVLPSTATESKEGTIEGEAPAEAPPAPPAEESTLVGSWDGSCTWRDGRKTPVHIGIRRAGDGYIVTDLTDGQETRATYATEDTIGWGIDAAKWDMHLTAPGQLDGTLRTVIFGTTSGGTLSLKRR